ncbi:MAG: 2-hydroxyacyl-CoA dehydratase family protein [Proteobacteria bacterium]|nr:2-hydroxyacyl-CoA dehydratase family protein [Pseudomonadota bacterium]MBU4471688.1 2-hydroxyacyl-CoA dehydratase family protein [Pseudomonadota bacterium]MCG2750663.1 2-hydroxyacyl-CoA dehydratase family protein [Desulfobacteraceae bacterium]
MSDQNKDKQMRVTNAVRAYQREWIADTRQRVSQGEPFAICNGDDCEEILNVMGIPVIVVNYWHAIISTKRMDQYYQGLLKERDYPASIFSMGLACTMDNNPETAPWGGLPKPSIIVGGARTDTEMRILELWAREYGCKFWPMEYSLWHGIEKAPPPGWFDRIRDHWDELVDPVKLDYRVADQEKLIRYLEVTTGRKCSMEKLKEAMELVNEQMEYWRKARDLIAKTSPCPVSLRDQLSMYQMMWHRGTPQGRDFLKAYYEEVKERVENNVATCPNEKIRFMWVNALGTPPRWAQWAEEKYGAVCVTHNYMGIAVDAYARTIKNNDPLRTLAARYMLLFWTTPDWIAAQAKHSNCQAVITAAGIGTKAAYEQAGIHMVSIPSERDDEATREAISNYIESLS